MKEQILNCKKEHPDWGYKKIAAFLKCPTTTVRYWISPYEKQNASKRAKIRNRSLKHILKRKKDNFQVNAGWRFIAQGKRRNASLFTADELYNKLTQNPVCYLTGESIDLNQPETYQLDHIIPNAQGGDNSLENCGLSTRRANLSKSDMTPEEFIQLCKKVLTHNGYSVSKLEESAGHAPEAQ